MAENHDHETAGEALADAEVEELRKQHPHCKTEVDINCDLRLWLWSRILEEGRDTNCIIDVDKPWSVQMVWCLSGSLRECICGFWCPTVHLESIGKGPEFSIHGPRIPLDCRRKCYGVRIPGRGIKPADCSTPYKLVTTLQYLTPAPCYNPGPIVGFCELPLVQFYDSDKSTT